MESIYKVKNHLKAKSLLMLIAAIWGSLILICLPIQAPLLLAVATLKNRTLKEWNYSFWMLQDQFTYWVLSGHHETTVSSAIGRLSETSKTANAMRVVVDWLFYITAGQKEHCRSAIEKHDTHRFSAKYACLGVTLYFGLICFYLTR